MIITHEQTFVAQVGGRAQSVTVEGTRFDTGPSLLLFPDKYREVTFFKVIPNLRAGWACSDHPIVWNGCTASSITPLPQIQLQMGPSVFDTGRRKSTLHAESKTLCHPGGRCSRL